jgi:hypothetical protein
MCSVFVAGCAPAPVNTNTLGEAATAEEIKAHFSGKSFRLADGENSVLSSEAYFASDGTYKMVAENVPQHSIGRWEVRSKQGQSKSAMYILDKITDVRGQEKIEFTRQYYFNVYIQPDGSSTIVDIATGRGNVVPRPAPGFPLEQRYNALKKQAANL